MAPYIVGIVLPDPTHEWYRPMRPIHRIAVDRELFQLSDGNLGSWLLVDHAFNWAIARIPLFSDCLIPGTGLALG